MNWNGIGGMLAGAFALAVMGTILAVLVRANKGRIKEIAGTAVVVLIAATLFGISYAGQWPAVGSAIAGFLGLGTGSAPTPGFAPR